ncbi:MAG: hypothetical protein QXK65_00395 [Candidatus Micrarchaeaceae archaeon]
MVRGKNITLTVTEETWRAMKAHGEINWSDIARRSIDAFAKALSKADEVGKGIESAYGSGVETKMNIGFSEGFNENKWPAQDGMYGFGYNSNVGFNVSIYPTKKQAKPEERKESK